MKPDNIKRRTAPRRPKWYYTEMAKFVMSLLPGV